MRVVVEVASARPRRMASMEREPRTLSLHELNYAREAALYVLSTHTSQDAARIFTQQLAQNGDKLCVPQGLKPVLVARSSNSTGSGSGSGSDSDSDDEGDVFVPEAFVDDDTRHRQLRGRATKKRDFATAPF
uniref:Uncharacterized protein n=1 Tax=Avena sativa TaxID=4498 RepID=A0ACD5W8V9_AVESA